MDREIANQIDELSCRLDRHEKRIKELEDMAPTTLANGMTVTPTPVAPETSLSFTQAGTVLTSSSPEISFTDPNWTATTMYDIRWSVDQVNIVNPLPSRTFASMPGTFEPLENFPTNGETVYLYLYSDAAGAGLDLILTDTVTASGTSGAGAGGGGSTTAGNNNPQFTAVRAAMDAALNSLIGINYHSDGSCNNPNNASLITTSSGYANYEAFIGLKQAWLTTEDTNYLNRMIDMANVYIDDGADIDGDGYDDWWSCNTGSYNDHHYEWRAAAGIGLLLNLLQEPSIPSSIATTSTMNKLGDYLRVQVWEKWHTSNTPNGQNTQDGSNATHMLARLIPVAISLEKYYGGTAAGSPGLSYAAWLNSGPGRLLEDHVLHPSNQSAGACNIRGRYQPAPGADISGGRAGTNDVGHAQDVVVGLLLAADEGYSNNPASVRDCLCNALNNVIWDGTGFDDHVDGSAGFHTTPSMEGWFLLVQHCPENLTAYTDWALANTTTTSSSFPSRIATYGALL